MKKARLKIRRTGKIRIMATSTEVKIKYPKQAIGTVALIFDTANGEEKILKQWELVLQGDRLTVSKIK